MKKIFTCIICLLMMLTYTGCSREEKAVRILCPAGAPSLAFVSEYENIKKEGTIDFVDGTDQLIAELSKNDSEYDIIVAPINIGTNLMSKNQTNYKLKAIVTWGNLYVVGKQGALSQKGELALFGEGAVPQKIYDTVNIQTSLTPQYYQSASLVQQQLLAEKVNAGVLAEPLASATIAKAKQSGIELSILTNLQKEYGENGYPQAAIFVKDGKNFDSLFEKIDTFTNQGYEGLQGYLETIGIENLSLPSIDITVKTMDRQNVHYKEASEYQKEIKDFLKLFNIEFNENMLSS